MNKEFSERCPNCGEVIKFTEEATQLQCKCGHEFLVVEFVSKRREMERTEAAKATAEKQLAQTEKQKEELQARLNNTLTALEHIEGTQKAEDEKLDSILEQMKEDRQAHSAMEEILRAVRTEQTAGQDTLRELLQAVMKSQSGADAKLDAMQELAARILKMQQASAADARRIRHDIQDEIDQLKMAEDDRNKLAEEFYDWSRSMQRADVERLKKLQNSSNELLQGQKKMSAKLEGLEKGIAGTKAAVEKGFDKQERQRLEKMIELYHQATGHQVAREFETAKKGIAIC